MGLLWLIFWAFPEKSMDLNLIKMHGLELDQNANFVTVATDTTFVGSALTRLEGAQQRGDLNWEIMERQAP